MKKSLPQWQLIKTEKGTDLKLFQARYDYMRNPRNQKTEKMIILEGNDSVNVVAITPEEHLLFVRQYRFGIGAETLELPGGIVDDGEEHAFAAKRELREETGFSGGNCRYLGKIASNPVFMDSWIHHYLIRGAKKTHELVLDEGEDLEVVSLPIREVRQKLWDGFFQHPHTVNALLRFFSTNE